MARRRRRIYAPRPTGWRIGGYGVGGDVRLLDLSGDALLLAEFWILPVVSFYQNLTAASSITITTSCFFQN